MKLAAFRVGIRDLEDAAMLARETGRMIVELLLDLHRRFFLDHQLNPRRMPAVGEVAQKAGDAS